MQNRQHGGVARVLSLFATIAATIAVASPAVEKTPSGPQPGPPGFTGIRGRVHDAVTGRPLPARLEIRDADGKPVASYYEHLPGAFTDEDGSFEVPLAPGRYSIEVHHGLDYLSERGTVAIRSGSGMELEFPLQPWVDLRGRGFVNGDGHAHLYTDKRPDDEMAARVRRICLAQGVDFLATCQEWSGYDETNWRAGYAKFSDSRFFLHFGAEMPKYRTGHMWWLGLTSTRGRFASTMDTTYENEYYQSPKPGSWTFRDLPFPNIPDLEVVSRFRAADGAAAVVPHPTSWFSASVRRRSKSYGRLESWSGWRWTTRGARSWPAENSTPTATFDFDALHVQGVVSAYRRQGAVAGERLTLVALPTRTSRTALPLPGNRIEGVGSPAQPDRPLRRRRRG